nr:zinc finger, CCHC-type, retrotransposon Gag domain protein [Tanacetum cinerariifolium]
MGCEDAFKTRLAVYKFKGDALSWWKAYKQAKGGDVWLITWGLRKSTLNHLMCIPFTDVAQVPNAARNYEILRERDDDGTERPDKRQKSSDWHRTLS